MREVAVIVVLTVIALIAAAHETNTPQTKLYVPFQQYNAACLDNAVSGCPLVR